MKHRTLLMIPGPIEFEPSVLAALAAPTTSHVAPDFIETFGQALGRLRQVFMSSDGQPFILTGSGTLAMDSVGANLVEPGDAVLVISTGFFSDRFADIYTRYGAQVTVLRTPLGGRPSNEQIAEALDKGHFKLMSITHVETSTGVLTDPKEMAALAHRYGALCVVDGICSVAAEELRMSDWDVDVALTASQKAVAVPPGLALFVVGPRAMQVFKERKTPVANYYADWNNWIPTMQATEARQISYFATPAVNLIWALNVSLGQILDEGLEARFARHRALSRAFKKAIQALGLGQVPFEPGLAAHTVTAPRYPAGVTGSEFLAQAARAGVTLAGGLHPAIKNEHFRIGHMGNTGQGELLATVGAIESSLRACGYACQTGIGVAAALESYLEG